MAKNLAPSSRKRHKKIQIGENGGERKINPSANPGCPFSGLPLFFMVLAASEVYGRHFFTFNHGISRCVMVYIPAVCKVTEEV